MFHAVAVVAWVGGGGGAVGVWDAVGSGDAGVSWERQQSTTAGAHLLLHHPNGFVGGRHCCRNDERPAMLVAGAAEGGGLGGGERGAAAAVAAVAERGGGARRGRRSCSGRRESDAAWQVRGEAAAEQHAEWGCEGGVMGRERATCGVFGSSVGYLSGGRRRHRQLRGHKSHLTVECGAIVLAASVAIILRHHHLVHRELIDESSTRPPRIACAQP
jgi:hypothetical protein